MIPLAKAKSRAARVVDSLRPFCKRIEIAGSIRRERPEVGDIDLVIEARDRAALEKRVLENCTREKSGPQYFVAVMQDGTQLDLWFANTVTPPAAEDDFFARPIKQPPDNFGSLLLCRTGSVLHNITLCNRAKKLGRRWNPHHGVYQDGQCIASATETEIYHALGLEYIEPTAREFTNHSEQLRLINRMAAFSAE